MNETVPTYKRWREDVEKWMRQGEALEAIAVAYPDIPFTICPISNTLGWCVFEENIQAFSARVRKVAAIFGAPTTVSVVPESGTTGTPPDLMAQWKGENVNVDLRSYWPGCRIHPESRYIPAVHVAGEFPAIHPECADVLKELEDYSPKDASCVSA